ncbi:hypothetical protein RUND412_001337 [Rhizina undulata]
MPANTFRDACQTLLSIAYFYDHGLRTSVLQDTRTSNAIELRVLEARTTAVDKNLLILFVLFYLDVNWVRVRPQPRKNAEVNYQTVTIEEQHLILRQLIYNSWRLPPGCEAMFEAATNQFENKNFIPSFLLPLKPLSPAGRGLTELKSMDLYAENNAENKLASSILCSGCDVTLFYCPECRSNNCRTHKHFCESVSSPRSITCHVERLEPPCNEQMAALNLSHLGILAVQRDMMNVRNMRNAVPTTFSREQISGSAEFSRSRSRRGTKERFIVKIEVIMGSKLEAPRLELMISDDMGTLKLLVNALKDPAAYEELLNCVRGCVFWNGIKMFAYARHIEGDVGRGRLEIMTGVLPDQELFW